MTKTITVSDDAYRALAALKRSGKDSFTKVILRLTGSGGDPLEVAGAWGDMEEEEARALIRASRERFQDLGGNR